jgi:hypothetical protein
MLWKLAQRVALDGRHALSDVKLAVDDSVDVASGRVRHGQRDCGVGEVWGEMGQT